ncbi:MAG: hypothetical protein WBQ45_06310 [Roseiarcus sp.]
MLSGLKTHCGGLTARPLGPHRYTQGFFADGLLETLKSLPEHLWPETRRKKDYLNDVLGRAKIESGYRPARKLWKRRKVGYYMPAPDMKLRRRTAEGEAWVPHRRSPSGGGQRWRRRQHVRCLRPAACGRIDAGGIAAK